MIENVVIPLISLFLGGGIWKGIDSVIKSRSEAKEKAEITRQLGARTPAEVESITVATMNTALRSAGSRIKFLEDEREKDQEFYQGRIDTLEVEREADRLHYQQQLELVTNQLNTVRNELAAVEKVLNELKTKREDVA